MSSREAHIDIDPASGVALATLIDAAQQGLIGRQALILLNITGGGSQRRDDDLQPTALKPALCLDGAEQSQQHMVETILKLF